MHNIALVGVRNAEQIRLRSGLIVILIFCILTIVSYFNELAREGLLSGDIIKYHMFSSRTKEAQVDDVLLRRDGVIHALDINLAPLHKSGSTQNETLPGEINIKLHVGKNSSDTKQLYKFNNVIPNFYLDFKHTNANDQVAIHNKVKSKLPFIRNATTVFMYQHDIKGYVARDCLIAEAQQENLLMWNLPLNTLYRTHWEMMPSDRKHSLQLLYGAMSFGVCENLKKPCFYVAMVSHPLDHAMQIYQRCRLNASELCCILYKVNFTETPDVTSFVIKLGNNLLGHLLYNIRHCKLVGSDEICIHDTKTSFVLSQTSKQAYVKYVKNNLENWFLFVGLLEQFEESLALFKYIFGWKMSHCQKALPSHKKFEHHSIDNVPYEILREKLLDNKAVVEAIKVDIDIYNKVTEIFKKQLKVLKYLPKG